MRYISMPSGERGRTLVITAVRRQRFVTGARPGAQLIGVRWGGDPELPADAACRRWLDLPVARDGGALSCRRVLPHLVVGGLAGELATVFAEVAF
jgi:hypothetical protein